MEYKRKIIYILLSVASLNISAPGEKQGISSKEVSSIQQHDDTIDAADSESTFNAQENTDTQLLEPLIPLPFLAPLIPIPLLALDHTIQSETDGIIYDEKIYDNVFVCFNRQLTQEEIKHIKELYSSEYFEKIDFIKNIENNINAYLNKKLNHDSKSENYYSFYQKYRDMEAFLACNISNFSETLKAMPDIDTLINKYQEAKNMIDRNNEMIKSMPGYKYTSIMPHSKIIKSQQEGGSASAAGSSSDVLMA